jgi:hypothetical protein
MTFREWTVLPHQPIEKLSDNLWTVSGTMPKGHQRRMVIAKLQDGRLLIHNAIALDPDEMQQLEAFGEVAAILVPNGWHRQDARIWKDRYPKAKVFAPSKTLKKVAEVVAVDGAYDQAPRDDTVIPHHIPGTNGAEGVLEVKSTDGLSLIFNDALLNVPPRGGLIGFLMAPTGRPAVPRYARWLMIKDKAAFAAQLRQFADQTPRRVLFGHGATVDHDAAGMLRGLADELK